MRPRKKKRIDLEVRVDFFKPAGIPMRNMEFVELVYEEVEALRLKNIEGKDQIEASKIMNTSQSTFQRILSEAYKKVSIAIVEGKAIKINKIV